MKETTNFWGGQKVWDEVLWEEENKGNQNVEQEEAAHPNVLPH